MDDIAMCLMTNQHQYVLVANVFNGTSTPMGTSRQCTIQHLLTLSIFHKL